MRNRLLARPLITVLLGVAGILGLLTFSVSAQADLATQPEFVASWIAALKASGTAFEIEIVDDLEITAKAGEIKVQASARRAYENYLAEPATREEQIDILVDMVNEALEAAGTAPDISKIVPMIKRADWLAKYKLDCPYYALPGDLIAILAEDRPDEIRHLRTADLERLEKSVPELFSTAISNLRAIAPIEEHDLGSFVLLSSDGNYEAGLMLDAQLIAGYGQRFAGEIVFAVPAADVFVLTGRDEQEGLGGIVRAACAGVDPEARLSSKVFAARDGGLEIVGEVECAGKVPVLTME